MSKARGCFETSVSDHIASIQEGSNRQMDQCKDIKSHKTNRVWSHFT